MPSYVKTVFAQCKNYANFFQKIRICKFWNFCINFGPTIRIDHGKRKYINKSIINSVIEVLQSEYIAVIFDFLQFCNFSLNTLIYILTPTCQMGDFGRQNSLWNANSLNFLQFLFLQYDWSELEVLVFLKRNVFIE